MVETICVAGAGTMGSGIALAAAQHHFPVILFDTNSAVLQQANQSIHKNLEGLVAKNKLSEDDKIKILSAITFTSSINDCKASLIVEAIVEKIQAKAELFQQLATINTPETIFASNTSSLSIASLQALIPHPERVAGLHFFNPAQIMKLVEVVEAPLTQSRVIQILMDLCRQLGKTPVHCTDAPGFIVNRVARHYYLEAMKLVEQGLATFENVDEIMEATGFKMGPFKLMDLIGMDINLAVSESLYQAFDGAIRFQPSPIQIDKVKKGHLGRKTGQGFYQYTNA